MVCHKYFKSYYYIVLQFSLETSIRPFKEFIKKDQKML